MSLDLYSSALVELAKQACSCPPPEKWTHRSRVTSSLCGDDLELFLRLDDGRCVEAGFEVEACVLCRASAVVMQKALQGQEISSALAARKSLERAIAGQDESGPYAGFGVLAQFPSRQSCALLPWKALERAQVGGAQSSGDQAPLPSVERESSLPQSAFAAIEGFYRAGESAVLATLIAVDGSSPSPLGSQMAVSQSGAFWGSVSGGCVESAVVAEGLSMLTDDDAPDHQILQYRIANSQAGEVGLPCGGEIQVYLCRAPSPAHIANCLAAKKGIEPQFRVFALDGTSAFLGSKAQLEGSLPAMVLRELHENMDAPILWSGDEPSYFVEPIRRAPPLLIVGGTHIAQSLSALAQTLGFAPVIIEPRAQLADPRRFPGAQVVHQAPHEALQGRLAPDCAVVMLTHNPRLDDPAIKLALPSSVYYVGALGSRKTQKARLERLSQEGVAPALLEKIHGPVGLAIGAQGASEIALSILAQVVQSRRRSVQQTRKIGAVVLAAGQSSRFGGDNKLLAPLGDTVVVAQVVQRVLAAGIGPCMVVLGHDAQEICRALDHLPVQYVDNPDYASGMGSSVSCGIQALAQKGVDAAFVVLGDMPSVRIEDYEALAAAHRASIQHLIVAPEAGRADARRLGNPILWPRRYFEALGQLKGDRGAKSLLLDAPGAVLRFYIDHPGVLRDIDRPEDLPGARALATIASAQEAE